MTKKEPSQAAQRAVPLVWDEAGADEVGALRDRLVKAGADLGEPLVPWKAQGRVAWWRGDVDLATRGVRAAIDPGTSDRLALLLGRIAASAQAQAPGSGQPVLATASACAGEGS